MPTYATAKTIILIIVTLPTATNASVPKQLLYNSTKAIASNVTATSY